MVPWNVGALLCLLLLLRGYMAKMSSHLNHNKHMRTPPREQLETDLVVSSFVVPFMYVNSPEGDFTAMELGWPVNGSASQTSAQTFMSMVPWGTV